MLHLPPGIIVSVFYNIHTVTAEKEASNKPDPYILFLSSDVKENYIFCINFSLHFNGRYHMLIYLLNFYLIP